MFKEKKKILLYVQRFENLFLFYSLTKAQYKRGTEGDREINAVS